MLANKNLNPAHLHGGWGSEKGYVTFFLFLFLLIPLITTKGSGTQIDDTIKIGLLISNKESKAALHGAELAVMEVNKEAGDVGTKYHLVIRSMEGPWGTGSTQAVDLIFGEKVTAIIGSHDGRNAHLVEQVSTKAHVVFLSAWSGDPTLSQAFVPWFFNCVPNDVQQAGFLLKSIYKKNNQPKVAIVSDGSYDSESALKNFLKINKQEGHEDPLSIKVTMSQKEIGSQIMQINKAAVNTIILTVQPSIAGMIFKEMNKRKMNQSVYCYLSVLGEDVPGNPGVGRLESAFALTSGTWYKPDRSAFNDNYQRRFRMPPGPDAAYAYDATKLIMRAVRAVGTEREFIQAWLLNMQFTGVTGTFVFDEKGNRSGDLQLIKIKNGIPVEDEIELTGAEPPE